MRSGPAIDVRGQDVHQQDGEGNALGIGTEYADEHGDDAAADAEDDLTFAGDGGRNVVRRHEDGAQHGAAGKDVEDRILVHQQGHDRDGGEHRHGDLPGDDLSPQQVAAADQQCDGGNFAHGTADGAQEHVQVGGNVFSGSQQTQRGGTGDAVHRGALDDGAHTGGNSPVGHRRCETDEQDDTADDCGVREVLAQTAEDLLNDDDRGEAADDSHPQGQRYGQVERQDDAGDDCGPVADGLGSAQDLSGSAFEDDAGGYADSGEHESSSAEDVDRDQQSRAQSDHDVSHDALGIDRVIYVRSGGYDQIGMFRTHYLSPPSFFSSSLALVASASALAFSAAFLSSVMTQVFASLISKLSCFLAGQE